MPEGMTVDDRAWDPASGVGLTATEAAAARAAAGRRVAALIEDPYAEMFVRAVGIDVFVELASGDTAAGDGGFALPRMVDWVSVRTKYLDDYFAEAQVADVRQVVILGAGLDSRAFRLEWLPGTAVYELDQPGMVDFKTAVVDSHGVRPRAGRFSVPVDLCGDWATRLLDAGFEPELPTAWCAEGLLPYLPPGDQVALLDTLTTLSAPGSRFAADTVDDLHYLTAQIARSMRQSARPREISVEIDAPTPASAAVAQDVIEFLAQEHGWDCAATSAPALFEVYGVAALAPSEHAIFQRIRLAKAVLVI